MAEHADTSAVGVDGLAGPGRMLFCGADGAQGLNAGSGCRRAKRDDDGVWHAVPIPIWAFVGGAGTLMASACSVVGLRITGGSLFPLASDNLYPAGKIQ